MMYGQKNIKLCKDLLSKEPNKTWILKWQMKVK